MQALLQQAGLPRLRVPPQAEPGLIGDLHAWWYRVGPAHRPGADGNSLLPTAIVLGPADHALIDLARRTDIALIHGLPVDSVAVGSTQEITAPSAGAIAEDRLAEDRLAEAMRSGCQAADAALAAGTRLACCLTPGPTLDPSALALMGAGQATDAYALIGLPAIADAQQERQWAETVVRTRDLLRRVRTADPGWPTLVAAGSVQVCAAVGVLLTAAARRVPVMLDGVSAMAAGQWLASQARGLPGWWRTAGSLPCPGASLVEEVLGAPLLDTRQRITDGRVGLLAVEVLRIAQSSR